jgi:hypothetical protein
MFENKVLRWGSVRRIEKMHNKELHNPYFSRNIFGEIKSRTMTCTEHKTCTGKMSTKFWSGNLKGRDHLEEGGVDVGG